jgi:hypothetical protein
VSLTVLDMFSHRISRRLGALGAALLLLATAAPSEAHHAGSAPGPVNAQTTFGWGKPIWQDDFVGGLKPIWKKAGHGTVRNQNGMLTLNTTRSGSISATLARPGARTGRWEIRLRSRRYATSAANYTVRTELIPVPSVAYHCGARNIVFEGYKLGANTANLRIRNLPNRSYDARTGGMNLGNDRWHTFAVEVTATRISWYVDAHVLRTEKRPEAFANIPFTVRFTMAAVPGKTMNQSRMQMDWLRQYDLSHHNTKSTAAPMTTASTFAGAC